MKNLVIFLALAVTPFGLGAGESPSRGAEPFVLQVHPSKQKVFEFMGKSRVSLPQLRIYDRAGRLLHDFGFGFEATTFSHDLSAVLRSPVAAASIPVTLPTEVNGLLDASEQPLTAAPAGDLVIVEYSAIWCRPCHAQNEALLAELKKWPALRVVLLQVSLDAFGG